MLPQTGDTVKVLRNDVFAGSTDGVGLIHPGNEVTVVAVGLLKSYSFPEITNVILYKVESKRSMNINSIVSDGKLLSCPGTNFLPVDDVTLISKTINSLKADCYVDHRHRICTLPRHYERNDHDALRVV